MGWKASSIIINPTTDLSFENILHRLGFTELTKIEDEPYEIAVNPGKNKIFIGTFKDSLIISIDDIPLQFFNQTLSTFERVLISMFPNSEICAISLHSGVNHWGFAVIKNGQKIRVKAGDAEQGTIIDFGEPLKEEKELLSKSTIDNKHRRIYTLDTSHDESYTEDQVGENFVFEIFGRYTGTALDRDDELLFETNLTGYQISTNMKQKIGEYKQPNAGTLIKKPWWKIW